MKTLKDVAGLYRELAKKNLQSGPLKAFKTGNLYRNVSQYNTLDKMIRPKKGSKKGSSSFDLILSVSPPGAKYGKFVEHGTYKMKARPFGQAAATSIELKRAIDAFMQGEVDVKMRSYEEIMTEKMVKGGFTAS